MANLDSKAGILEALLEAVKELPVPDLPAFMGKLEEVRFTAQLRLTSPIPIPAPESLLDVTEAAKRLGMSENYLYRHSDKYAFTRREGRKLLFSSSGIDAYIRQREPHRSFGRQPNGRV